MVRHHYGKTRYDLVKGGCLTIRAKVMDGKIDEESLVVTNLVKSVDALSDFDFSWKNWWYEQTYNCKLGTTEALVECMMAERFLNDYWNGAFSDGDHLSEVIFEVSTDNVINKDLYDVAYWFKGGC